MKRGLEGWGLGLADNLWAPRVYLIPPLLSKSLVKGELNVPGRLFEMAPRRAPQKSIFGPHKVVFPRFHIAGLCRGSAGSQIWRAAATPIQ